jgi:hypothetical protein
MMTDQGTDWGRAEIRSVPIDRLDERLQRYRLVQPQQERAMAESLRRYGQISPIAICIHQGDYVLIDGFKRLHASRTLKGCDQLDARHLEVDEQGAKAAIYNLNRIGGRPLELEEAWIVYTLVREDQLAQTEAAQLLGRHKSWVNRRLALLERLCPEALEELRLGLLTPSLARQLTRLPVGNQAAALAVARAASLTATELAGVVDLLLASSTAEQTAYVFSDPRRALRQADDRFVHQWDPRMSVSGNRVAKRLALLLDCLAKIQSWLRYSGRSELQACDREPLLPGFTRLVDEARIVSEVSHDFVQELELP